VKILTFAKHVYWIHSKDVDYLWKNFNRNKANIQRFQIQLAFDNVWSCHLFLTFINISLEIIISSYFIQFSKTCKRQFQTLCVGCKNFCYLTTSFGSEIKSALCELPIIVFLVPNPKIPQLLEILPNI
jgi:hypothetical protein